MALSEAYTFSATVSTTELSLTGGTSTIQTRTTAGYYDVWVDKTNIAKGDHFIIRMYEKVTSGGTQHGQIIGSLFGVQDEDFVFSSPQLRHGFDFTIVRIAGADRSITASVRATT